MAQSWKIFCYSEQKLQKREKTVDSPLGEAYNAPVKAKASLRIMSLEALSPFLRVYSAFGTQNIMKG